MAQTQDTNGNGTALAKTKGTDPNATPEERSYALVQRKALALASSTLVPEQYRGQAGMPNVMIALEIADRIGASPLMVMQNLHVVKGRPTWSSQFLIACVNSCGRFTPMRFEWDGEEGTDGRACRATAKDKQTGEICIGTWITWKMAKAEGWTKRDGSKWLTMPEQMFCYRAAAFWARVYAPELSLGMHTSDEVTDGFAPTVGVGRLPEGVSHHPPEALEQALGLGQVTDAVTGEVVSEPGATREPGED